METCSVIVDYPALLLVKRFVSSEAVRLWVYRSPMVKPSDPLYQPVLEVLGDHDPELVEVGKYEDPGMVFGKAVFSMYRLHVRKEVMVV